MRTQFFFKILFLCIAIAVIVMVVSNLTFNLTARRVLINGLGREAMELAGTAAGRLDLQPYERLFSGALVPGAAKGTLTADLRQMQKELGGKGVENIYVLAMRGEDLLLVADNSGEDLPLVRKDDVLVAVKRGVLARGVPDFSPEPYADQWGTWISGYAPVRDSRGEAVMILGVDLPLGAFPLMDDIIRRNILTSLIPSMAVALLASLHFSGKLTKPIRLITGGLQRVREGDFGTTITVASRDELGRMAEAFNDMTGGLAERERIRSVFNQAVSETIAAEMLSGRLHLEGERREVTVLFTDIRGFTALSEKTEPERIIEMLNDYFSVMAPIVTKHGGVVDKFVGDELFAIFGAPVAIPDDALAAVRAALEMQGALARFNAERAAAGKEPLSIGIGVNTGPVVAGTVGSRDRLNYTVLGQTVNVGARLCTHAAPRQILVSEAVADRVRNQVGLQALPPLAVKGVSMPLCVFEVTNPKEANHA